MLTVQDRQADTAPPMLWRARAACDAVPESRREALAGLRQRLWTLCGCRHENAVSGSDWKCRRHATCTSACLTT